MMGFEQIIRQAMMKKMFGNLQIPNNINDPVQILQYLQSSGQLKGIDIPQGMTDPDQITQYLLQSGKLKQEQYNKVRSDAMQMFGGFNGQ